MIVTYEQPELIWKEQLAPNFSEEFQSLFVKLKAETRAILSA